MCKILEQIGGLNAESLLEKYQIEISPPIDLTTLLKRIGISAYSVDFSEAEKAGGFSKGTIVGAALSKGDTLTIMYDKNIKSNNRIRFTVAHELAHCCLHSENLKINHLELRSVYSESSKETEANIYAGELLIPKQALLKVCNMLLKPSITNLTEIFQVSENVMKSRLKHLGILNLIEENTIDKN